MCHITHEVLIGVGIHGHAYKASYCWSSSAEPASASTTELCHLWPLHIHWGKTRPKNRINYKYSVRPASAWMTEPCQLWPLNICMGKTQPKNRIHDRIWQLRELIMNSLPFISTHSLHREQNIVCMHVAPAIQCMTDGRRMDKVIPMWHFASLAPQ